MKKILALFILLVLFCAFATDMCARDDTMVLVFDPLVSGSGGSNANEWTWWTAFPYGTIAGDATCLSVNEGLGRVSGAGAYYGIDEYANTFITADTGLNGLDADGNERKYCWCKMTYPVSSRWVFKGVYSSAIRCKTACANECSGYIRGTQGLRAGIFDSIGL